MLCLVLIFDRSNVSDFFISRISRITLKYVGYVWIVCHWCTSAVVDELLEFFWGK